MANQGSILQNPENERYFVWTGNSLKLVGTPPAELVHAWDALTGRKEKLTIKHRVKQLLPCIQKKMRHRPRGGTACKNRNNVS
jgi:hypothetical protein